MEFNPQTFTSTAENGARPKTHSRTVPTTEVAIKSLQVSNNKLNLAFNYPEY